MRAPRGKGKNITRVLYIKSEGKTMDEIEMMMTKSHSIAARTARNYREEEECITEESSKRKGKSSEKKMR